MIIIIPCDFAIQFNMSISPRIITIIEKFKKLIISASNALNGGTNGLG